MSKTKTKKERSLQKCLFFLFQKQSHNVPPCFLKAFTLKHLQHAKQNIIFYTAKGDVLRGKIILKLQLIENK